MVDIAFTKVKLPYGWCGNMSPHPVTYEGVTYRTTEHLFHCLRFADDHPIRQKIVEQKSPMAAKMVAKPFYDDHIIAMCSEQDVANMFLVVSLKVEQHPDLGNLLDATGDARIIEDCTARPRGNGLFWGAALQDGAWIGDNVLGEIWMKIRESRRSS